MAQSSCWNAPIVVIWYQHRNRKWVCACECVWAKLVSRDSIHRALHCTFPCLCFCVVFLTFNCHVVNDMLFCCKVRPKKERSGAIKQPYWNFTLHALKTGKGFTVTNEQINSALILQQKRRQFLIITFRSCPSVLSNRWPPTCIIDINILSVWVGARLQQGMDCFQLSWRLGYGFVPPNMLNDKNISVDF